MSSSATAATRRVTPELVMELRRPTDAQISPDGRRLAYVVSPAFKERDRPLRTQVFVDDEEIALDGGASLPRWAPDSQRLALVSDTGHAGRMSPWIVDAGEPRELGGIAGSVEDVVWSPDGASLLVLAADVGADRAGAQTATKIKEASAAEDDPKVYRPATYWRRLFLVDVASGEAREVGPQRVNVFEVAWAGGDAVAVCTDDPAESAWYDAWIGRIDLEKRTVERVHTAEWQLQCPRISPGGKVAWIEGFASDRAVVTGTVHVDGSPLAPELDITWIAFDGDHVLWYAGWRREQSMVGRLALDGSHEELWSGEAVAGMRFQPRVSVSEDGRTIVAPYEGADDAPEVARLENGRFSAVTSLNDDLAPQLRVADWREYTWQSFDGLEIGGLLSVPRGYDGGALPLVVAVHGGPTGTWSWSFTQLYGLPLLLAEKGFATFFPNPRGSVGRGQEFARANLGDMGGGDLQDILAGVDALVGDGIVDDARIAITGGSYGGFMSSWAVTQTDRFAAAVPFAVVTDWTSFHYTTNIGQFDVLFLQGHPDDPTGPYPKWSPVFHAKNCKTPTLIIHGADDLCTPLPQATEFYNALVEAGCETELVVYPREGHGWLEREHQIDAWQRIEAWLDAHVGNGSGPPE